MTAKNPMSDGFWLEVQDEQVVALVAAMRHARQALEAEQYGEAWLALNTELKALGVEA